MERWSTRADFVQGLTAVRTAAPAVTAGDDEQRIIDWLSRLTLFYGVPFYYLVPDPRMLPDESIRFFQVDGTWVASLLDGAFSLGQAETGDAPGRTALAAAFATRARAAARTIRPRQLRQGARIAATQTAATQTATTQTAAGTTGDTRMSGVLLRSAVVAGWPGLQVKGYADQQKTQPLQALRIDRVASNILFCLFEGPVACVTVSEAAETLHFGVMMPDHPGEPYRKDLKYVESGPDGQQAGTQIPGARVGVDVRPNGRRVVDVAALQKTVHDGLIGNKGIGPKTPYTPAEFALELIQGVQEVDFTIA